MPLSVLGSCRLWNNVAPQGYLVTFSGNEEDYVETEIEEADPFSAGE
jgi:hypothetical protein